MFPTSVRSLIMSILSDCQEQLNGPNVNRQLNFVKYLLGKYPNTGTEVNQITEFEAFENKFPLRTITEIGIKVKCSAAGFTMEGKIAAVRGNILLLESVCPKVGRDSLRVTDATVKEKFPGFDVESMDPTVSYYVFTTNSVTEIFQ